MRGRGIALGFAVGVGASAAAYYAYKKNQDKVDGFLRKHGVNVPVSTAKKYSEMSLEELVETKEDIEDIIAEKETTTEETTEE